MKEHELHNYKLVLQYEGIRYNGWQKQKNQENTVAVHIRRIREKIEVDPKEPMYLKVVWGIGYKISK